MANPPSFLLVWALLLHLAVPAAAKGTAIIATGAGRGGIDDDSDLGDDSGGDGGGIAGIISGVFLLLCCLGVSVAVVYVASKKSNKGRGVAGHYHPGEPGFDYTHPNPYNPAAVGAYPQTGFAYGPQPTLTKDVPQLDDTQLEDAHGEE